MTEIRKADPAARRQAMAFVLAGVFVGSVLIFGFERCRPALLEWLISEPEEFEHRLRLLFILVAAVLFAPLIGSAIYLWLLGTHVLRAREFPPPGYRVLRDTTVITGQAAVLRGRSIKALALCLAIASALSCLLLWQLAGMLRQAAA